MTCWKHSFTSQFDATFWGPAYQCHKCGWWHIRFIDLHIPWGKGAYWGALIWCGGYVLWIIVNVFIKWNYPQ